jgi:DnaJ-class molecular chaperone
VATHTSATIPLIITITVVTIGYILACAIWPFRACRRCGGLGRHHSPSGRAWRSCKRCHGTGGTLRVGRRIYTYFKRTHDQASRGDRR